MPLCRAGSYIIQVAVLGVVAGRVIQGLAVWRDKSIRLEVAGVDFVADALGAPQPPSDWRSDTIMSPLLTDWYSSILVSLSNNWIEASWPGLFRAPDTMRGFSHSPHPFGWSRKYPRNTPRPVRLPTCRCLTARSKQQVFLVGRYHRAVLRVSGVHSTAQVSHKYILRVGHFTLRVSGMLNQLRHLFTAVLIPSRVSPSDRPGNARSRCRSGS